MSNMGKLTQRHQVRDYVLVCMMTDCIMTGMDVRSLFAGTVLLAISQKSLVGCRGHMMQAGQCHLLPDIMAYSF
jgi:hypothetical protein